MGGWKQALLERRSQKTTQHNRSYKYSVGRVNIIITFCAAACTSRKRRGTKSTSVLLPNDVRMRQTYIYIIYRSQRKPCGVSLYLFYGEVGRTSYIGQRHF